MRKGEATRQAILDHAVRSASKIGLEGLSIGVLAKELELSKSGLFAHFQSKDQLKAEVIERAATIFSESVVLPALTKPRGLPRIREMFVRWLGWSERVGLSGCIFVAAGAELDDQPGPPREALVRTQGAWMDALTKAAQLAIDQGHFSGSVEPAQFAHELYGVVLGYHHANRLMRDPQARERSLQAFEALVQRASSQ